MSQIMTLNVVYLKNKSRGRAVGKLFLKMLDPVVQ